MTGGEWVDDQLTIFFRGPCPDLETASLVIDNRLFALVVQKRGPTFMEIKISAEASAMLERPVPVVVRWADGQRIQASSPIFVCNRKSLEAELTISTESESLKHVGRLELEDEEFEQLLTALGSTLLIDRRSVWQIAGRAKDLLSEDEENTGPILSYADLDYEALRQHPRIQQYLHRGDSHQTAVQTRLQVILNAITGHFNGLIDGTKTSNSVGATTSGVSQTDFQDETEREAEEIERETRHRS